MKDETKYVLMFSGDNDRIVKFYVAKDSNVTFYKVCAAIGSREDFSSLLKSGKYTLVPIDKDFFESVKAEEQAYINFTGKKLKQIQKEIESVMHHKDDINKAYLLANLLQDARNIQTNTNAHKKGLDELRAVYEQSK